MYIYIYIYVYNYTYDGSLVVVCLWSMSEDILELSNFNISTNSILEATLIFSIFQKFVKACGHAEPLSTISRDKCASLHLPMHMYTSNLITPRSLGTLKICMLMTHNMSKLVFEQLSLISRSEGFPGKDIWSLGLMAWGFGQMGEFWRRWLWRHLEVHVHTK